MQELLFRPAVMADLPQVKAVYREIVADMTRRGLSIWDDIYPCEFLESDIRAGRLHLLTEGETVAAAFALCPEHEAVRALPWLEPDAPACYLDRLGVNVRYARRGLGSLMLTKARDAARQSGAAYLRLLVVESNTPAIRLYEKNGMTRVPEVFEEVIDEALTLTEYGYEAAL